MLTYKEVIQIELAFARMEIDYVEWRSRLGYYGNGMVKRLYRQWGLQLAKDSSMPQEYRSNFKDWETFLLLLVEIYK